MNGLPKGIHVDDARHMTDVKDGSVTLVVTSPPYCVDKPYEKGVQLDEWLQLMKDVMQECDRVLIDGGRACINIADINREPYIPLSTDIINISRGIGWKMRGTIIWMKGAYRDPGTEWSGSKNLDKDCQASRRAVSKTSTAWGSFKKSTNPVLRDSHEFILVFNKGNRWSIDPGESGMLREEFMEFTKAEWWFQPDKASMVGHPAPFPDELPRRCVLLLSNVGNTVLDPFGGSGTTAKVARALGRNAIMYEKNEEYVPVIKRRLEEPVKIQSDAWEYATAIKNDRPELYEMPMRKLKELAARIGAPPSSSRSSLMQSIIDQLKRPTLDDFARSKQ